MQLSRIASVLVLVVVGGVIGGILANFLTANDLLRSSAYGGTAAILSFGVVAIALALFAALGQPWKRWDRTPYW